jgi:hypothetical protein
MLFTSSSSNSTSGSDSSDSDCERFRSGKVLMGDKNILDFINRCLMRITLLHTLKINKIAYLLLQSMSSLYRK